MNSLKLTTEEVSGKIEVMNKTLDIPVKDLPFEAGQGFRATVENGIAHVVVTTVEEEEAITDGQREEKKVAGREFLKKWAGVAKGLLDEAHSDDARAEYLLNR